MDGFFEINDQTENPEASKQAYDTEENQATVENIETEETETSDTGSS